MMQLYFLSILCNGLCGYILFSGSNGENEPIEISAGKRRFSLLNPIFHLVLGVLSAVTGVLKLLSPAGKQIPILGDLVPAAACMAAGFIMIFGIYRREVSSSLTEDGQLDRIGENFLRYRKALGLALLAVAVLHFLFPQALFL